MEELKQRFALGHPKFGAWKSEVDSAIIRFASLGAKNYSFRTHTKEFIKCRGITRTCKAVEKELNHKEMHAMVKALLHPDIEERRREILCTSFRMNVDRRDLSIENRLVTKRYNNFSFNKRVIDFSDNEYLTTRPFGCRHLRFSDVPPANDMRSNK